MCIILVPKDTTPNNVNIITIITILLQRVSMLAPSE